MVISNLKFNYNEFSYGQFHYGNKFLLLTI